MLNYKDPIYWFAILALAFFLWGQCSRNKVLELKAANEESLHQEKIAELARQAKSSAYRADSLRVTLARERTETKSRLTGLKIDLKGMSEKLEKLRIPIKPLVDSLPDLGRFIRSYDSLSLAKDSIIAYMELRHASEVVNLEEQLRESGRLVMIEAAKGDLWRQSAESAQKNVRKEVRRKTFWKITSGVLAAGLVVISIRE